ncbi:hypothetical protein [Steroidobacter sp.]|uniref:hypothetical protein n=1 Tax=Steroidobacter sp. TaxID=1978227 RepID=UPI001A405ABF|nr:hypothetical protein [Steroidobacter sp.]MBL8268099.1 hypothetical protein [Steroidobacter sp.]
MKLTAPNQATFAIKEFHGVIAVVHDEPIESSAVSCRMRHLASARVDCTLRHA